MTDPRDNVDASPDPVDPTIIHCHAEDSDLATGECIRPWPHRGMCMNARGFRYTT